jgi:rhomboid protease GluP
VLPRAAANSPQNFGYYRRAYFSAARRLVPLSPHWRYELDRWKESVRRFFQPEKTQRRPQICPACGSLVGVTATRCHQCGASLRFSTAAVTKTLSKWMPTQSPTTYAMLSICCLFYGISLLLTIREGGNPASGGFWNLGGIDPGVLVRMGSSLPFPYLVRWMQPWRLVTACFLHGSLIHILFNMWVLMDIGPIVEELYGSARYLFLYTMTGIAGYVVSSIWMATRYSGGRSFPPIIPSIGASGALLGLIGLLIAVTSRRSGAAAQMLKTQLIRWVVYIFVIGFIMSGTDNAAHFGGLASGFLLGRVVLDRQPHDMVERKRANALGWGTAFVIAVCFGFMFVFFYQVNHPPQAPAKAPGAAVQHTIERNRS